MKEYIDKEDAIDILFAVFASHWKLVYSAVDDMIQRKVVHAKNKIKEAPAADVVERKRGEWEVHPQDTFAREHHCEKLRCKNCWHFFYRNYGDSKLYCPSCGADMRSHHDSLCDQTEEDA